MSGDIMRDRPEPNGNLVKIFDTDSAGIDADLTSTDAVQETFPGVGGVIILVRAEDAEKARRIIVESQEGGA
jgi:hypothetical protein